MKLRAFMFSHVYENPVAKGEEGKAVGMLQDMYHYYCRYPEKMTAEYTALIRDKGEDERRVVCDYLAGMSDKYAISRFNELFVPRCWQGE